MNNGPNYIIIKFTLWNIDHSTSKVKIKSIKKKCNLIQIKEIKSLIINGHTTL